VETVGLVDTGSTFTVIPRRIFDELGLKPTGRRVEAETAKEAAQLEETYLKLSSKGVSVLTPSLVSDELPSVLVGVITLDTAQARLDRY